MENSIVMCTGSDCTICSVLTTVSSGINFLMGISAAAAVLILVIAGLAYIFTIGRQRFLEKAKVFARGGIIGFMLVVTSWLVVRTLFFVSGYQDESSWWSFSCETQEETSVYSIQTDSLESLKTYPDMATFLASGAKKARISGPTPSGSLMAQLDSLKAGEELIFYLPAKNNKDNSDVQIPFLAGYKSGNGQLSIDSLTTQLLEQLTKNVSSGGVSLLGNAGSVLSQKASASLTNYLISLLWDTVISNLSKNGGVSNDLIEQLKSAGSGSVSEKISAMTSALSGLQQSSSSVGNATVDEMIGNLTNEVLKNAELVARKTENNSVASREKEKSSGDRSETGKGDKFEKWKDTQPKKEDFKKDPGYSNLPSTKGENPVGDDADRIKDPDKDDSKVCDYSKATNPAEEALIRIECKDQLRYNMIHRFVKKISNTDFPGGFCEGCGEIAVNFNMPRQLLDQLIMHESTHSAQFCLGIIDMSRPEKVEREACANQMGSLCREKHDENEGKGTDDYLMQEITCAGGKDEGGKGKLCRQKPHITFKEVPAGTEDEEVRGYLSRWHVDVNPSGDLKCEAYEWPVRYAKGPHGPQGQQDSSNGRFHYGAHHCGDDQTYVLGLYDDENNHVKTIVKSQEKCRSKARPNLPKTTECEESGGSPIEIDSTLKQPPGM